MGYREKNLHAICKHSFVKCRMADVDNYSYEKWNKEKRSTYFIMFEEACKKIMHTVINIWK